MPATLTHMQGCYNLITNSRRVLSMSRAFSHLIKPIATDRFQHAGHNKTSNRGCGPMNQEHRPGIGSTATTAGKPRGVANAWVQGRGGMPASSGTRLSGTVAALSPMLPAPGLEIPKLQPPSSGSQIPLLSPTTAKLEPRLSIGKKACQ